MRGRDESRGDPGRLGGGRVGQVRGSIRGRCDVKAVVHQVAGGPRPSRACDANARSGDVRATVAHDRGSASRHAGRETLAARHGPCSCSDPLGRSVGRLLLVRRCWPGGAPRCERPALVGLGPRRAGGEWLGHGEDRPARREEWPVQGGVARPLGAVPRGAKGTILARAPAPWTGRGVGRAPRRVPAEPRGGQDQRDQHEHPEHGIHEDRPPPLKASAFPRAV